MTYTKKRFKHWVYPRIIDGELTEYNWIVQNINNFKMGSYVDIGAFSYINAKNGVLIEDNVQIGSHCSIYTVSTIDNRKGPVKLSKNCRIGSHSTILPNVTIGENSVIGAHSFINSSIPANVIAFGVPAKIIKNQNEK